MCHKSKPDGPGSVAIDFEGIDVKQIFSDDFGKISVLSQDHVCRSNSGTVSLLPEEALQQRRAQREKVVMMLVAPTQVAVAFDIPSKEGHTVLIYTCMHGLNSVVEHLSAAGAKPEITDMDGLTALLLACGKEDTAAANLLIAPTAAATALDVQD